MTFDCALADCLLTQIGHLVPGRLQNCHSDKTLELRALVAALAVAHLLTVTAVSQLRLHERHNHCVEDLTPTAVVRR